MKTKPISFVHDSITYTWADVPFEKYNNWLQITKEALNTEDYTARGFPFMLQVEPTSLCNLSCPLCPTGRHELNRPYRHMRLNEFKSVIDDMEPYLLFLILWDWGEPLMNPELPAMIRYAAKRGIQTVTSTNAHFLNDAAYTEELLNSGLTTLIVAVDSIGADRYKVYRKDGDLDRVLGGLNNTVSVKKRIGSRTLINVRMVVMKQNEHEIEDVLHLARVSGADLFTVKSLNPSCGVVSDEDLVPTNLRYRRYEYIPDTYERVRTDAICRRVWTMSNIFSNGDVVPCCYDYDSEMKVGNVFETPFTQIWNNSQYRQLRKKIYHDMQSIVKCNHCGINFKLSENGWFVKTCDLRSDQARIPFSIIMPTYNRKHCIKKAIDSLLTQTYQNFELIIVDDASTDGTEGYLTEIYKEEIKKEIIRIIRLPQKRGVSFARNQGVGLARYHWIAYLDTDNQMRQDFLETFADRIEKNASYEIYYAQIQHSRSGSVIGHEFNFDDLIQFNFIDMGVFVHSVKIYHELGGFDVHLDRLVDWDLIIKYTEKYPPLFIDKVLLDYDDNTGSSRISNSNKASADEAYKYVILGYYERLSPQIFIERHAGHIQSFQQALAERDREIQHFKQAVAEYDGQILDLQESLAEIRASRSWRITAPLRSVATKTRSAIKAARILPQMVQKGGGISPTVCKAAGIFYREGFSGVKARLKASLTEGDTAQNIHEYVPSEQAPPLKTLLTSQIYRLQIPLARDEETGWKSYPVFHGATAGLDHLACHVSVLINGHCPHPPHAHQEEELLLFLEGEVDLVFPGYQSANGVQKTRLKTHEFVYYPAGFAHTLESVGNLPAQYLMIKWHGREMKTDTPLSFRIHGIIDPVADTTGTHGFHPQVIFEGPTAYLKKLQCHRSLLSPGAGYATHADPYDVFIIVLEGELETLGARATPYDVIFYQAGVPHGMRNPGESAAQYLVFEFHC